jgi:Rad3-related DNA helicase
VRGGALFAACRGRLIEGIDFSDELARAVVLIGVPNLPPCAYVDMKLDYL